MATPYAIIELDLAESTQDEARARFGREAPILVISRRQTKGRGRLGREWVEPDQAVFASLAFDPVWPVHARSQIPLAAGLAVRDAIADECGITVGLRWPNDLVLDGGKVGGVLVESGEDRVVVGCGINLVWEEPIEGAAALYPRGAAYPPARDLALAWTDRFLERVDRTPGEWGIAEYRDACVTIGRRVDYVTGSGTAVDVSEEGALLVETVEGVVAIRSGEVRLHGPATLPIDRRPG